MSRVVLTKLAGQDTPPIGRLYVYAKADGHLYCKNDDGTEYDLTTGTISDYLLVRQYVSADNISAAGIFVNVYKDTEGIVRCRLADPRDENKIVRGYTTSSCAVDEGVNVVLNESVLNVAHLLPSGSTLEIGADYYLGFDGGFTTAAYTGVDAKFTQKIGVAITDYEILVTVEQPIYLNNV